MPLESRPQARPDVETHVLPDGSCLLFDPVTLEGHALDLVGALVWEYCDGTATRDTIAGAIAALVPRDERLRERVMRVFDDLSGHDLLLASSSTGEGSEIGSPGPNSQG